MRKISVPIAIQSLSDTELEKDLEKYLDYFKKGKVDRVFITVLPGPYTAQFDDDIRSDKFKRTVQFFKENGFETGVWISCFGHGGTLSHEDKNLAGNNYRKITGVMGETAQNGYCPSDENFTADYTERVKYIAELNPDMIMLDDDFRLNLREGYHMGCFCSGHLKEFYRLTGEEIPREKIEGLVFSGGKNKYRDAYMDMLCKTLTDFAVSVRKAIDEVNPEIRAGVCTTPVAWDFDGTDVPGLSKVFAGKTRPFVRTFGAPYHFPYSLIETIENERMQMSWIKNTDPDTEVFSEGDVYPRPRYNVASKQLELFDLILSCDPNNDGCLKYMFDYDYRVGYEEGYIKAHIRNADTVNRVTELFADKQMTGISVFEAMHKIRNAVWDKEKKPDYMFSSLAASLISKNSIPTSYEETGYPVFVGGESARYIPAERLKNGAVLDSGAALILKQRGIDVGLISAESTQCAEGEYYINDEHTISYSGIHAKKLVCSAGAEVLTLIYPQKTPGAYKYENADGTRFLVFAGEFRNIDAFDKQYFNNYYRQHQVTEGIEWAAGKKLPAVCEKNPNLYIMAAKNDKAMSILAVNIFADEIAEPVITLDKAYSSVRFLNCSGDLRGNKLYLSEIPSFGFAAFEVKE